MAYRDDPGRASATPVALITLNRPKALNALNAQLMDELDQALAAFDAEPDDRG